MGDFCPCCGQVLKGDNGFSVSLEFNTVIVGERALRLGPKEAEITFALKKAWPGRLTKQRLIAQVWGAGSDVEDGTMRNTVFNTNKKLKRLGWIVRGVMKSGYKLEKIKP